ncbi:hypothetical protein F5J12DRAFT_781194 [Pisolithus orientalis]|uniref:uncharacterized protein n=1 Tax=Pisolithus orientalis TaxID=936130 RepID=UPI00222513A9|nr:uncharacterized protein F5J12DRAFT_781194 [Pisolithus orientalis]KAI6015150.1 hypothetical protein F5J12DRAFT_781194 [Pisolithus orientalis]
MDEVSIYAFDLWHPTVKIPSSKIEPTVDEISIYALWDMTSGKCVTRGKLKGEFPRIDLRGATWKEKLRITLEGVGEYVQGLQNLIPEGCGCMRNSKMGIQNSKRLIGGEKSVFEIVTLKNYIVQGK